MLNKKPASAVLAGWFWMDWSFIVFYGIDTSTWLLSPPSVGLQCLYAVDIDNTGLRHRVCERVFVQADREFNPVLRSEAGLSSSYYLLDVVGVLACYQLKMTCPSNTSVLSSVGPVFGGSPISGCAGDVGVFVGVGVGSGDGVGFIPYIRPRTVQFSNADSRNQTIEPPTWPTLPPPFTQDDAQPGAYSSGRGGRSAIVIVGISASGEAATRAACNIILRTACSKNARS